jgi:hypothetical protein
MILKPLISWQSFVKQPGIAKLSLQEQKQKYLQEQLEYESNLMAYNNYATYVQNRAGAANSPRHTLVTFYVTNLGTFEAAVGFSLTDVKRWNEFLDTAGYADNAVQTATVDPFTATVSLRGATNLRLKDDLFTGITSILKIEDSVGSTLPSITAIGARTFKGCTALTTVTLGNCTSVGVAAFQGCTGLLSVNLRSAVSLAFAAFSGSTALPSVNFPNVTSVAEHTFKGTTSLVSLTFPKQFTALGSQSFLDIAANGTGSFLTALPTGSGTVASASIAYLKNVKTWKINLDQ